MIHWFMADKPTIVDEINEVSDVPKKILDIWVCWFLISWIYLT